MPSKYSKYWQHGVDFEYNGVPGDWLPTTLHTAGLVEERKEIWFNPEMGRSRPEAISIRT